MVVLQSFLQLNLPTFDFVFFTKTIGEENARSDNLYEHVPRVISNQCNSFQSMINTITYSQMITNSNEELQTTTEATIGQDCQPRHQ